MAATYGDLSYDPITNWTRGCCIRTGGMGEMFIGKNVDTGRIFLIKSVACLPPWSKQLAALQNERKILKKLSKRNCPNIFRMLGSTTSDSVAQLGGKSTMDLFLEFAMPRGNLTEIVQRSGKLKEPVAKAYTFRILQALSCMHRNGIVHCDIKGVNIIVCENGVKLFGFGVAKDISKHNMCTWLLEPKICSQQPSVPPHLIQQAIGPPPDSSEDICALGATVCEMVTGRRPILDNSSTVNKVISALEEDFSMKTMPDCLSFIKCCLKESGKASTFQWTAERLLNHPWIVDQNLRTSTSTYYGSLEDKGTATTCCDTLLLTCASPRVQYSSPLATCRDLMRCRSMDTGVAVVPPTKSQLSNTRPRKKGHKLRRFITRSI